MKIEQSKPVASVGAVARKKRGAAASGLSERPTASAVDKVAFMGIPEAELTPKVRAAIMSLMEEVEGLRREVEASRQRMAELEELADQDALLPVLNRRAFMRELTRVMAFAERYKVQAAMVYIDLDNFKEINDTYGHGAGDAVLARVAEILQNNIRSSDSVGRLGGDEFGVILASAGYEQAVLKGKSLSKLIAKQRIPWEGNNIRIQVSEGAYSFDTREDAAEALAQADRAMYETKMQRKENAKGE